MAMVYGTKGGVDKKSVELRCFICDKPSHTVRNYSSKNMVNELMACFEEMAKEKAIVGEEDDMEQPRIGALQLLNTVKIQKVDPK